MKKIMRCKIVLGICGTAAFFLTLGIAGAMEQEKISFLTGTLISFFLLGLMIYCIRTNCLLNKKAEEEKRLRIKKCRVYYLRTYRNVFSRQI